ncbi:MAG: hypothetical protein PHQ98_02890 [Candidatus ainarchaeum sp.]|nr:hypothetical protein [Candidatus ainarchaeum sp.]
MNILKKINGVLSDFLHTDKKYTAVIIICFLYAGFSLMLFVFMIYAEFSSAQAPRPEDINMDINQSNPPNFNRGFNPMKILLAPLSASLLIGGIVSLIAGISIWTLTRKKEKKQITHHVTNSLLLPDEKKIFDLLKNNPNGLTQSKLVIDSNLTKVKVHRIIKKFEDKKLVEKYKFGTTNKIILKE